jgi:hypothetical protein
MLTPFLEVGLRLFFFALLAAAIVHKLFTLTEFKGTVRSYFRTLSDLGPTSVLFLALLVIILESCVALAALLSPGSWAALSIAALLLFYAGAMGVNILVGNRQLNCGCSWSSMPVSWSLVFRNIALAFLAGLLWLAPPEHVLDFHSVINSIALAVAALCTYAFLEQVLHNHKLQERASS